MGEAKTCYLVVEIPRPTESAFLAIPFSRKWRSLSDALARASEKARLKLRRTDLRQEGVEFKRDIDIEIRKAMVVIAVCCRDTRTGGPNANVMYEVGFAQSIGKATLILTDDVRKLPSDIKAQSVLTYAPRGVQSDAFTNEVAARLLEMKETVGVYGVHKGYSEIRGIPKDGFISPSHELWRAMSACSCTDRHLVKPLMACLDILRKELEGSDRIAGSDGENAFLNKHFLSSWNTYASYMNRVRTETSNPSSSSWGRVRAVFQGGEYSEETEGLRQDYQTIEAEFGEVGSLYEEQTKLVSFNTSYESTQEEVNRVKASLLRTEAYLSSLEVLLHSLIHKAIEALGGEESSHD